MLRDAYDSKNTHLNARVCFLIVTFPLITRSARVLYVDRALDASCTQCRQHADVHTRIVSVLLILPHRRSCCTDAASHAPLGNVIRASRALKVRQVRSGKTERRVD